MKLLLDESTFGITQNSLKKLRDELATRINHEIEIHQVQTDGICCGYLIFDFTVNEVIWSGDGFRTDEGGEGGAGFKTARALLYIYGMDPIGQLYDMEYFKDCILEEVQQKLGNYIMRYLNELEDQTQPARMKKLSECQPQYLR
jgi:hypothetical protein